MRTRPIAIIACSESSATNRDRLTNRAAYKVACTRLTNCNSEAKEITPFSYSQQWTIIITLWHNINHTMTQYQSYYDTISIRLPINLLNTDNEILIPFWIRLAQVSMFPARSPHAFRVFCRDFLDLQTDCPRPSYYRDSKLYRLFRLSEFVPSFSP